MTSPLVLRPATSADSYELERLAALDSARPLDGDVLLASAGGEVRAALSLDSGRVGRRPVLAQRRARRAAARRRRASARAAWRCAAARRAPHSRSPPRGGYGSRR